MNITHFDYILDCDHTVIADVVTSDQAIKEAYHVGSTILCPECKYKRRKVTKESKSEHVV